MPTDTSPEKTFTLYTPITPNGFQISILLEELKAINTTICYEEISIDFSPNSTSKNILKEPWFKKINSNGTVPVLVDHSRGDFAVIETGAIMLYIAQRYDLGHVFWFNPQREAREYSTMLQWIFFEHGSIGPIQSQSYYLYLGNVDSEGISYAQKRYHDETKRLYTVLETRLEERDWIAGPGRGKFSLADMKLLPWVIYHHRHVPAIESLAEWPRVKAWTERSCARNGVAAGLVVPE